MNSKNAHLYLPFVQALADGKPLEMNLGDYAGWRAAPEPDFTASPDVYRIKPWSLSRHIPGFRPLGDGEEWHRTDWTEGMLTEGWRPLLMGEPRHVEDEAFWPSGNWLPIMELMRPATADNHPLRTRRPLPEPKKRLPLGPSDVPPGSAIRHKNKDSWRMPVRVEGDRVFYADGEWDRFTELCRLEQEILRPGQTEWKPCYREE